MFIEEKDIDYIHKKAQNELEMLIGNNLLLIGAGGFLGYYFIRAILSWNDSHKSNPVRITALSKFREGIPSWMKSLSRRLDIEVIRHDITKYALSQEKHYDYIIHAASIASPTFYRLYPIETINSNVQGLYIVLRYMLGRKKTSKPVKGLLYFSSSEIYGDPTPENIPTPETYRGNVSCTGPRACYDESKRFCETLCVNYAHVYNLPIRSARPFNNYRPGLKISDGRVIADFAKNILQNQDIIMYSDGSATRTFCYVADAIVGYMKILMKGKNGQAYNIGVEKPEIIIYDLAKKMVKIAKDNFGYTGRIIVKKSSDKNYLIDNPIRRCPQIGKARKELGYSPEISLDEGLYKILMWYKQTNASAKGK